MFADVETTYDREGTYSAVSPTSLVTPPDATSTGICGPATALSGHRGGGEVFGLHRTVARAHLEKLGELGLVSTATRRRPGGGRPAKIYAVTDDRLEIMLPPRRYERLARLLLQLVSEAVDPDVASPRRPRSAARSASRPRPTSPGATGSRRSSSRRAPSWTGWTWPGYGANLSSNGNGTTVIEVHNCVYSELSQESPDVVCAFDRSMLCGMLGVDASVHTQTHAMSSGDTYCRHEFTL